MQIRGNRVHFTNREWYEFFRGFPGSPQRHVEAHGFFEFDSGGDLVDLGVFVGKSRKNVSHDYDGYELVAFSQDAKKVWARATRNGSGELSARSSGELVTMTSEKHNAALAMAAGAGALAGAITMHVAHRRGWM